MLAAFERKQRARRTALRLEDFERRLFCTRCGVLVALFEATLGARTAEEHQWTPADDFTCRWCLGVE